MIPEKRYPQTMMATACIPWNEDYSLDERAFRNQIRLLATNKIEHIYLFGTAGEGYAVSDRQFEDIVRVFLNEIGDLSRTTGRQIDPMVGVISPSTTTVLERIKWMRDLGINEFQISLPSWGEVSDSELFRFFRTVCHAFPDLKFLHFNVARAKRLVSPREYGQLERDIPNLVATKNFTFDMQTIYELESLAPRLTHFNGEVGFAYGCIVGKPGLIPTIFNSNWRRAWEYLAAGVQKDWGKLFMMHNEYMELHTELFETTGSCIRMDGTYDKMYVKLHDPLFSLRLLPPYETHDDKCFGAFQAIIKERFPQWLADDG